MTIQIFTILFGFLFLGFLAKRVLAEKVSILDFYLTLCGVVLFALLLIKNG